jgi:hypothetical protein
VRSAFIAGLLALGLFTVGLASISWSAGNSTGSGSGSSSAATAEPIAGSASTPTPGSETPSKDPFTLFDTGPFPWSYDQLETDALRAQVDRGRDVTGWATVHSGFAVATQEAAQAAQASAAQHRLGVDGDPSSTGVVP